MEYRTLGRAGVKVSPLCLGTMMFGGPTNEGILFGLSTGQWTRYQLFGYRECL